MSMSPSVQASREQLREEQLGVIANKGAGGLVQKGVFGTPLLSGLGHVQSQYSPGENAVIQDITKSLYGKPIDAASLTNQQWQEVQQEAGYRQSHRGAEGVVKDPTGTTTTGPSNNLQLLSAAIAHALDPLTAQLNAVMGTYGNMVNQGLSLLPGGLRQSYQQTIGPMTSGLQNVTNAAEASAVGAPENALLQQLVQLQQAGGRSQYLYGTTPSGAIPAYASQLPAPFNQILGSTGAGSSPYSSIISQFTGGTP